MNRVNKVVRERQQKEKVNKEERKKDTGKCRIRKRTVTGNRQTSENMT